MRLKVSFDDAKKNLGVKFSEDSREMSGNIGNYVVVHDGMNGATFTPSVSEDGVISWTNDRELENPEPVNIKGADGKDGEDGYTPIKGIDYFDGKNGTNGKDGYTPRKGVDYFDGKNGVDGYTPVKGKDYFDGINGKDGKDGYTPVKGVDYFDGVNGKDGAPGKDGQPGADGKDGADGYTPIRGTDYWTDADKAEIKSYVDEAILGGEW